MALIARASAPLLLGAGDTNGAVNRAYYAMFDAARAALSTIDPDLPIAKTHQTIIRRFGQRVILQGGLDPSLGRALNVAEDLRLAADYVPIPIDRRQAEQIVQGMERFLDAVEQFVKNYQP